ncbi:MAG TPA: cupin domain-containing protein [Gaiellaceae bacterium]|nr:cupin domain-containing protein [Gaiellaceae bacterium]
MNATRSTAIVSFNLDELPLIDGWCDKDPLVRARFGFPLHVAAGSSSSGVVYMEIEPGDNCGRHWDSAEEVFFVRDGEAEIEIGDERLHVTAGGIAVAPALVPHTVYSVGETTLKILGFFPSGAVVARHDDRIEPLGTTDLVVPAFDDVAPRSA